MKLRIAVLTTLFILTSCSSSTNIQSTVKAGRVVSQAKDSSVQQLSIANLTKAYLESGPECHHSDTVVELTGEVIAYGLVEGGVYTITLRQEDKDAVCMFDDSISNQLGGGRTVSSGATLTIRGQCQASGLFSSHPFTLNGCSVISH